METRIWFTNDAGYINIDVTHEKNVPYAETLAAAEKALKEDKHFKSWTIFEWKIESPTVDRFLAEF